MKTKKTTRKFTPSQVRAKIVSILKKFDYTYPTFLRECGRNKAWLSGKRLASKAVANEFAKAVGKALGPDVRLYTSRYDGEISVSGNGYSVILNLHGGRQAFVQTVKATIVEDWAAHDSYPETRESIGHIAGGLM